MTWWEALILGIVQGLTEFFPVSSSGHLVLGQDLLGLQIPGITFDIVVHVATLVSVTVVYRDKLWSIFRGIFGGPEARAARTYAALIVLASIPAVIVGFTLKDFFEARFDEPIFAATMILVTGCVVWSSRWAMGIRRMGPIEFIGPALAAIISVIAGTIWPFLFVLALEATVFTIARRTRRPGPARTEVGWVGALLMGLGQAIAIFPGITRSGSTVLAGLWRGIDPVKAAEFSFIMSIPVILGAAVLDVPDALRAEELAVSGTALTVGFIAAMLAGIVAIKFFVALLRNQNFHIFAYYCWAAAGLYLLAPLLS
jgi:undecaprenyl-diphosphatase